MARKKRRTGTFLGIPYDWRRPTRARLKSRWWNRNDSRLFTPKTFGWGWVAIDQQGYCDGLLLSFEAIVFPEIVLNVVASSIKVGAVTKIS